MGFCQDFFDGSGEKGLQGQVYLPCRVRRAVKTRAKGPPDVVDLPPGLC